MTPQQLAEQKLQTLRDEFERLRNAASIDVGNLQSENLVLRRQLTQARNELAGISDEDSPEAQEVLALMKLWKRVIKNDHPNVKADLKSTRAAKTRAAVKRRGIELCRKAVLGCQYDDWAMGRVRKCGGKVFNDIAEHILNTDGDIEKFARLYDRHHVPAPVVYEQVIEEYRLTGLPPVPEKHPMRMALENLRERGCQFRESEQEPGLWLAQCPLHEGRPWSLFVRMVPGRDGRSRCSVLCGEGCDELVLLTGPCGFVGPSEWELRVERFERPELRLVKGVAA